MPGPIVSQGRVPSEHWGHPPTLNGEAPRSLNPAVTPGRAQGGQPPAALPALPSLAPQEVSTVVCGSETQDTTRTHSSPANSQGQSPEGRQGTTDPRAVRRHRDCPGHQPGDAVGTAVRLTRREGWQNGGPWSQGRVLREAKEDVPGPAGSRGEDPESGWREPSTLRTERTTESPGPAGCPGIPGHC